MKRFWPYYFLVGIHFFIVVMAAFAVHYSNGINVGGFTGDYGLWMDLSNLFCSVFSFSRWAIPVLLVLLLRTNEKKTARIYFIVGVAAISFCTWPLYSGLIHFWERNWILD
jgi:hypothetical protein